MSRTNKTLDVQKNPCQHWMQWDSGNGCWKAYDKETKQNISYPSDTRFICLDALSTVTGFSDAFQKGYYGNEVRNVGKSQHLFLQKKVVTPPIKSHPRADFKSHLRRDSKIIG